MLFPHRGTPHKEGKMSYAEFVWFLMSEEDKAHPTRYDSAAYRKKGGGMG